MEMEFNPERTEQRILCASCGTLIAPNPSNMCINCIRSDVDITDGIPKQATLHYCKGCNRYLQPPNIWVNAELESRQLLSLCLKKLKGLQKVRLVDAGFIWTEPHSRRIKVKLSIQKEVYASTILQQVFVVEYMVSYQQCDECTRVAAQLTWKAVVQVRQKVPHKRTFLWLEQLILKHNAHRDTTNIKEFRDGLDFYYVQRGHAIKMVEFLQSVVPIRMKQSEELISSDIHSGTSNYKFTYSIEIAPICKDDLVCMNPKMARSLSNVSPLILCSRVSNNLNFIDPNNLQVVELRTANYWETPFTALCDSKELTEFYVIDVQLENQRAGRRALATIEVAKANDLSKTFITRSHLGYILNPGDHALGYDLSLANFNNENWELLMNGRQKGLISDVILVKKSYPHARKKTKRRNWKLKNMVKEEEAEAINRTKTEKAKAEQDYEMFLRDLEEDPELRAMINLYKAPVPEGKPRPTPGDDGDDEMGDDDDEPEADFPEIEISELLEEMEGMALVDQEGDQTMD